MSQSCNFPAENSYACAFPPIHCHVVVSLVHRPSFTRPSLRYDIGHREADDDDDACHALHFLWRNSVVDRYQHQQQRRHRYFIIYYFSVLFYRRCYSSLALESNSQHTAGKEKLSTRCLHPVKTAAALVVPLFLAAAAAAAAVSAEAQVVIAIAQPT